MESLESLHVFFEQSPVGVLHMNDDRSFSFHYTAQWLDTPHAFSLSISLPLHSEEHSGQHVKSFFANLLPEAATRQLVARRLGISERNDFMLLKRIGGECAGAITLLPQPLRPESSDHYAYRSLSREQLADLIENIPRRPLLAGDAHVRMSLAGAQEKLALFHKEGVFSIPLNNAPSNCILKPAMAHFPSSIENEYFCMTLAADLGMAVPRVSILQVKDQKALLVERYDRVFKNDRLTRLHQEDFCQAMGLSHELKYQVEGGPGLEDCFELVRKHSSNPIKDMQRLLQWVFFNCFMGNMDAHAKNLSLLHCPRQLRLAPFYDILCTNIYPDLSRKLAMKIGGENRLEWIMERHWKRFAEEVKIRHPALKKQFSQFRMDFMNRLEVTHARFIEQYGSNIVVENIIKAAKQRAMQRHG